MDTYAYHKVEIVDGVTGKDRRGKTHLCQAFRDKKTGETFLTTYVHKGFFGDTREHYPKITGKYLEFFYISEHYKLGLTGGEIVAAGKKYEEKKAEDRLGGFDRFWRSLTGDLGNFFVTLVAVVSIAFTWGGATPAWAAYFGAYGYTIIQTISTAGTIAALAGSFYATYAAGVASSQRAEANIKSRQSEATKNALKAKEQSNALTNLIVYGGYEIYARGSIYNAGSAGTQSFSCTLAPDVTKGIRGDLQSDEISDMIHTRTGKSKAGGENFTAELLGFEFPLAKNSYGAAEKLDYLGDFMVLSNKRIADGFRALEQAEFGYYEGVNNVYQRVRNEQIEPIKLMMVQEDFLDKNKNYNRGLRADFDYLHRVKSFIEKTRSKAEIQTIINSFNAYENTMNSEDLDDDFKAEFYISTICLLFEYLKDYAPKMSFFYHTYDVHYEGGDNAGAYTETYNIISELKDKEHKYLGYHSSIPLKNPKQTLHAVITDIRVVPENKTHQPFKDFHFLDDFYHKDTNKEYDGAQIIKMYESFFDYLFESEKGVFFIVREQVAFVKDKKDASNDYFVIPLTQKEYEAIKTPLTLPDKLKKYDFTKIKKHIDNTIED